MYIRLPQLPKGAKEELPAGNAKMKNHRGTLAYWNMVTLFIVSITAMGAYIGVLRSDNVDLKKEVIVSRKKAEALQDTITSMLERQIYELRPAREQALRAAIKVDSLNKKL